MINLMINSLSLVRLGIKKILARRKSRKTHHLGRVATVEIVISLVIVCICREEEEDNLQKSQHNL